MEEENKKRYKLKKRRHLVTFVLTICFFVIGILIGSLVSDQRVGLLYEQTFQQNLDYESIQTQYLYIAQMKEDRNCEAVSNAFKANVKDLEKTRERLEEYIKEAKTNEQSYYNLKRQYTISQIRYWLLGRATQEICDRDIASILYFYSENGKCEDCNSQSMILTHLKSKLRDNLLVFSFDGDDEVEPMINIFKKVYNITEYPTVVVEDKVFKGLAEKDEILSVLCSGYKEEHDICKGFDISEDEINVSEE